MTPDKKAKQLYLAGHLLYGDRYQSALARELGVSDRTMRRWIAATHPIPDNIIVEVRALVQNHARQLNDYLTQYG